MKQILCEKPQKLKLVQVQKPTIKNGYAIVKLKRIGVCGTDLHAYNGVQPYFTYPRVLGHELSGTIAEIEESEQELQIGDKVAIIPYNHCGDCLACKKGKTNCCQHLTVTGVHQDGGMQEYIAVPITHLMQVNDLSFDEAAIIEPLAIGAHAIRRAEVNEQDTIAVVGAGPIGLGIMLFAKKMGLNVIAIDINQHRLQLCREWLELEHTFNPLETSIDTLKEMTNGHMVDVVFDATGNKSSMEQSLHYIAFGGKVVFVGLVSDHIQFYNPDFHKKETTLLGSRNATKDDFIFVYESLKSREALDIEKYITHRACFEDTVSEFLKWLDPQENVIKAMIEL
ncbi:zinc-binding alcohol dehydrogenase family protein [Alkalihalobacillus trypoxylicola]|uniref:Alcohol dehydrogenase n=1 Tax=Alkalihalobacillus trypoxylicola TaxID=519424 RepID=A0A162D1D2_9BACI|nr:zinc-binding alcohol dehydrogenase family protein [Alkalihalobacillus trypoxylicola]KYG27701.1 alcohol dehydrogenase [Alkalihalobacillus trypoxylicola]